MIDNPRKAAAAVLAAGLLVAGSAGGTVITDKEDDAEYVAKKPVHVTHSIKNRGFNVELDTITSATLEILLTDDNDSADYRIDFGSGRPSLSGTNSLRGGKTFKVVLDPLSIADLASTGWLDMTISAKGCKADKCPDYSFKFVSSTLTVNAERLSVPQPAPPTTVPEPGTLSLLGLGLAGLAALGRRRTRRPSKSTYGDRHGSDPNPQSTSIAHSPMEAP